MIVCDPHNPKGVSPSRRSGQSNDQQAVADPLKMMCQERSLTQGKHVCHFIFVSQEEKLRIFDNKISRYKKV